jgi:CO/xanthine dehydrogenase FAD-binding subunit
MKPAAFAYVAPTTLAETLDLLAEYGSDARLIAGGQTLGPMLNMRLAAPRILVDINQIRDFPSLSINDRRIRSGALVRQRDALEHPDVARLLPIMRATLNHVGHFQTRTRGTLCGSIAHADPTAELPLLLLVLGGSVWTASRRRQREVAAANFFVSSLTTALEPDEMILAIDWPLPRATARYFFDEVTVRHGHIAVVACAARAELVQDGSLASLSLGITGTAERPFLVDTTGFVRAVPDASWRVALVEHVRENIECNDDLHASAAYRTHVAGWLVDRALVSLTSASSGTAA